MVDTTPGDWRITASVPPSFGEIIAMIHYRDNHVIIVCKNGVLAYDKTTKKCKEVTV